MSEVTMRRIESRIVGYELAERNTAATGREAARDAGEEVVQMGELVERPEHLVGSTYKLKPPDHVSGHAMYITINDIVLNAGTEFEQRRPFEVFINTKSLEHYQWIVALTLIMSAVFRKGGDITFLVSQLHAVFDPRGGYWNKGRYIPSMIAEIGDVIERHLVQIGMMPAPAPARERVQAGTRSGAPSEGADPDEPAWAASATFCAQCGAKAVVVMDGCAACRGCGDSSCG